MTDVLIEPSYFLADPQVRPFVSDQRQDLAAANAPITSEGHFIIASLKPPRGQVVIIKAIVPYAMERILVGAAEETVRMLDPVNANGFFSFAPSINDAAPFIIEQDYNAPRIALFNDLDRVRSPGISDISQQPWADAQRSWFNPLFSILVPSDAVFRIVFSILPPATTSPLPPGGQYGINGAGGTRNVDFAGCMIVGQQMSAQYYHGLEQRFGITRSTGVKV